MGLSEEQGGAEERHDLSRLLKLRSSPMFEILSKNWQEANES
jgi:hypothetical protein